MKRLSAVLLVVLLVPACTDETAVPSTGGGANEATLTVEGRAFGQAPQVAAGESFTIDNRDSVRHTFTSSDQAWPEVSLAGNSTALFVVPADLAAGSYRFICTLHSDMGGTLTVTG